MSYFKIITDSTADLPRSYVEENDITVINLSYTIHGETYGHEKELPVKDFYTLMRNGDMPSTSQVNPEEAMEAFREIGKEYSEILCINFSSGLSGTYNSFRIAATEYMDENPNVKICVIDSKCASLGEGLFVNKAVTLRKEGRNFDEVADYLENNKLHFVHVFTVDDLYHLYRGGRVSKTTAFIGTMINIKPLLHVDDEGHLIPLSKVRGRKKSLNSLVDMMEKQIGKYREENEIIMISHGDCIEDAEYVRDEVKRRFGINKFIINEVGPTIGAHSGPGTLALFFFGEHR